MLPSFIIIALASAFLIALIGKRSKLFCEVVGVGASLVLFIFSVCSLFVLKNSGPIVYKVGGWSPPLGICLVLDGFSAFMLVILNLLVFLIALYSVKYMERYTDKYKFYCLFMFIVAGANGVILTGDIFNLFVFLEIASIAGYALVGFGAEAEELEAAFKYAVMGALAAVFILLGIALLYAHTSTLNMADISLVLSQKGSNIVLLFVSVLFIAGFGIKSAIVPFHGWIPDAYPAAPASVSALLAGGITKTLGIYSLLRIFFNVFGVTAVTLKIFTILGAVSILAGVLLAIGQWDFKRLLAYHSISQIGYIILGISLGTPLGILGGLFHLFNHSIFKSLLFLNAGAVEYSTDKRDLRQMGGLKERMPVTAATSWIASMAISGMPPFNGFWSKLIIIFACIQADRIGLAFVAVIGSLLTLSSFVKVQKYAFFGKLNSALEKVKEVPVSMQVSMIVLAAICLLGGILLIPQLLVYFIKPAVDVLLLGTQYAFNILGG